MKLCSAVRVAQVALLYQCGVLLSVQQKLVNGVCITAALCTARCHTIGSSRAAAAVQVTKMLCTGYCIMRFGPDRQVQLSPYMGIRPRVADGLNLGNKIISCSDWLAVQCSLQPANSMGLVANLCGS
jgi:hypothetical protein